MAFCTSGATAISTTADAAVALFTASHCKRVRIVNTGAVAGYFSVDSGTTYFYLPATASGTNPVPVDVVRDPGEFNCIIYIKRVASGSNVSNVFGYGW